MTISRRILLQCLSTGAAATVAGPWLAKLSAAGPSGRPIRLNRNENAYGPSEQAMAAMRQQVSSANRYADVDTEALRRKIAAYHRVTPEQVVLGLRVQRSHAHGGGRVRRTGEKVDGCSADL